MKYLLGLSAALTAMTLAGAPLAQETGETDATPAQATQTQNTESQQAEGGLSETPGPAYMASQAITALEESAKIDFASVESEDDFSVEILEGFNTNPENDDLSASLQEHADRIAEIRESVEANEVIQVRLTQLGFESDHVISADTSDDGIIILFVAPDN